MHFIVPKPWHLPQRMHTPLEVYRRRQHHRREFLRTLGLGAAGICAGGLLSGCSHPTPEQLEEAGAVDVDEQTGRLYPATRNEKFEYGRLETLKHQAAEYTNFYEFSTGKDSWRYVGKFEPSPWTIEIDGLCSRPRTLDMDDIHREFPLEERHYRHRCVEKWAMCVPWTGFPLRDLLKTVDPKPEAKFVAFETFNRPHQAQHMARGGSYPWPYTEGLTMPEAANELAFIATGVYGEPLPKQHGAPLRLVVPWKYGFKSIKSIVRITLTDLPPDTFWNVISPHEYAFEANVDPDVPHPRWSQKTEWMLGTREEFDTILYNGYGEFVSELYSA